MDETNPRQLSSMASTAYNNLAPDFRETSMRRWVLSRIRQDPAYSEGVK